VSEETDSDRAALGATMLARIESDGVGSPTHEKAITQALNAIHEVQEVIIENGATHVTGKERSELAIDTALGAKWTGYYLA
jgi:hypothetical protein